MIAVDALVVLVLERAGEVCLGVEFKPCAERERIGASVDVVVRRAVVCVLERAQGRCARHWRGETRRGELATDEVVIDAQVSTAPAPCKTGCTVTMIRDHGVTGASIP